MNRRGLGRSKRRHPESHVSWRPDHDIDAPGELEERGHSGKRQAVRRHEGRGVDRPCRRLERTGAVVGVVEGRVHGQTRSTESPTRHAGSTRVSPAARREGSTPGWLRSAIGVHPGDLFLGDRGWLIVAGQLHLDARGTSASRCS